MFFRNLIIKILYSIIIAFLFTNPVRASAQLVVGHFSEQVQEGEFPRNWETLEFDGIKRHSSYSHVSDGEVWSIQATSHAGSSGLIRKIVIDPSLYSQVSFSWKVQEI